MSGTSAWWNTIIIILYFVIERSSAYYFPWVESNGRVFYRQLTSNITRRRHTTYIVCSIIKALSNTHSTMISRGINFSSAHLKKMLTFPYRTVVVICLLQLQHERKKKNIRTNRAAYTIDLRRAIFIHVKRSEHTYIFIYFSFRSTSDCELMLGIHTALRMHYTHCTACMFLYECKRISAMHLCSAVHIFIWHQMHVAR